MKLRKIIAVLAAALMLCSLLPLGALSVAAAPAVIYFEDFENGQTNGWSAPSGGTVAVVANSSLSVPNPNGGDYVYCHTLDYYQFNSFGTIDLEPNTDYVLTYDAYIENNNWPVQAIVAGGSWLSPVYAESEKVSIPNTKWTTLTFNFNSGNNAKVYLGLKCTWEDVSVYFDNIKITEAPNPYVEGIFPDGGFESGTYDGWTKHETVAVNSAAAHSGNYGVSMKDHGTWGGIMNRTIPVEAGATYELSFWIKVNKFGINLQIKNDNSNGASLASGTWYDYNNHSEWTKKTYTITPGTNTLYLNFCGGGTSGTPDATKETDTYVDDFALIKVKGGAPSNDGFLTNGDFEHRAAGWDNLWGSSSLELVGGRNSDLALSVSTTKNWAHVRQTNIAVEPNTDYVIQGWFKDLTAGGVSLLVKDGDDTTNLANKGVAFGEGWTLNTAKFNSGNNTSILFSLMAGEQGASYVVDDIRMYKASEVSYDGYLYNGDFESGTADNWHNISSKSGPISEVKHDGNYALAIYNDKSWNGMGNQTVQNLVVGAKYNISMWVKSDGAYVNGSFKDANGTVILDHPIKNNMTEWKQYTTDFVATTETAVINFSGGGGNSSAGYVYVDSIVITLVEPAHTHNYVGTVTTPATCGEDGVMTYACDCGEGTYTEPIPATGEHTYNYACDEVCAVCGAENPNAAHSIEHVAAKAGTDCQTYDGNMEYWYCTECNIFWADEALTEQTNYMSTKVAGDHSYFYACDEVCEICFEVTKEATHNIIHVDAKAGTDCQTYDGNMEYWTCDICNMYWADEALTQQTNANNVKVAGEHSYFYACDEVCEICFEVTKEATHNITYVPAQKGTDCVEWDGHKEYWTCDICNMVWEDEALTIQSNLRNLTINGDHYYGDEYDGTCDICGEYREDDFDIVWCDGVSMMENDHGVTGLGVKFIVNAPGLTVKAEEGVVNGYYDVNDYTLADYDNAQIQVADGTMAKLVEMGADVTNNRPQSHGNVYTKVPAKYLYELYDNDDVAFVIRIINIPEDAYDVDLVYRPYVIVEIDGVQQKIVEDATIRTVEEVLAATEG